MLFFSLSCGADLIAFLIIPGLKSCSSFPFIFCAFGVSHFFVSFNQIVL